MLRQLKCESENKHINYRRLMFISKEVFLRSRQIAAIRLLADATKQKYCDQLDKIVVKLGLLQK